MPLREFTAEQLSDMRVACAEAAGWTLKQENDGEWYLRDYNRCYCWSDSDPSTTWNSCIYRLSDWPNDRNAMVKLIAGLDSRGKENFGHMLMQELGVSFDRIEWETFTAIVTTPVRTLCKCYLQAKGLWDALEAKWKATL